MPDERPGIGALAAKIVARTRSRGLPEVGKLAVARVREALSSDAELIVLARSAGDVAGEKPGYTVTAARPEDGPRYERDIGTDSATTFAARLSDATRCFVVEHDGHFLHATWVTTAAAWTREIRSYFRPPDGDAYVYESFTHLDARGRGLYPFALEHIAVAMGAEGVSRLWVAVEADNPASLRAVTKAGFSEVFRVSYGRRLGRLYLVDPTTRPDHPCAGCIGDTPGRGSAHD